MSWPYNASVFGREGTVVIKNGRVKMNYLLHLSCVLVNPKEIVVNCVLCVWVIISVNAMFEFYILRMEI